MKGARGGSCSSRRHLDPFDPSSLSTLHSGFSSVATCRCKSSTEKVQGALPLCRFKAKIGYEVFLGGGGLVYP